MAIASYALPCLALPCLAFVVRCGRKAHRASRSRSCVQGPTRRQPPAASDRHEADLDIAENAAMPDTRDSAQPPVLIAGGGIGGLSLALTLHQIGVPCIVFEAVSRMEALGVGINLQPNAVRELY